MKRLYVAYGSNMNTLQMGYRCPNARALGKGILRGYSLEFRGRNGNGVATIIRNRNTSIPVVLWSITDDSERALDAYEGFPTLYYKKDVEVEFEGRSVKAMAYIMASQYEDRAMAAQPSTQYFQTIREGYHDFGIDTATIEKALIRAINNTSIPRKVIDEMKKVSREGRVNMFDVPRVQEIALEHGYTHLASFLDEPANLGLYGNLIIYGD